MVFRDKLISLLPPDSGLRPKKGKQKVGGLLHNKDHDRHHQHLVRMRNVFAAPIDLARDFVAPLVPKSDEEVVFLRQALERNFIFTQLTELERDRLIQAMDRLPSVKKGSDIITQGDKGDYMYVIQQGTVRFLVDGEDKGEASKGATFGELAILYDCPRAATVRCLTDCDLWRVSQFTFRRIKAAHALQNDHETRLTIKRMDVFKDLPEEYINKLADSLFEKNFKKGDVLSRKGEAGETLYIINKGYVRGTDISVGSTKYADLRLGPGEYFGEWAIVSGRPSASTVVCETDGTAWLLTKERFLHTLGHLDMEELIRKSQAKKMLAIIPIFAYSDIDEVEIGLMASKLEYVERTKGSVMAIFGEKVTPALYMIRSGAVELSDGSGTSKLLGEGEIFAFGEQTLLLTNELNRQLKKAPTTVRTDGFVGLVTQAARYLAGISLAENVIRAKHDVVVTEDAKFAVLPLASVVSVIYDVTRLGQAPTAIDPTVTKDVLEKHRVLGAGTFGRVWLTRHNETNQLYALKVQYKRDMIEFGQATGVIREKNIMARMNHPFVMSIVNSEQDDSCLFMVMNLLPGGELRSRMHTPTTDWLDEATARFYAAGILEGLSYMHRRHFVYRDLKGENVLLDKDGYCVIVDLGFAKYVMDKTYTFCGTPLFIAPEVILCKGHNKSADVWSFGVLLYEMLTGLNPFYGPDEELDQMELFSRIVHGKWSFPQHCAISPSARDIIQQLLVTDPKERLGCLFRADLDVREHPWFSQVDFCKLYKKEYVAPWVPVVGDPLEGANFEDWGELEKEPAKLPLTEKEQQLFKDF